MMLRPIVALALVASATLASIFAPQSALAEAKTQQADVIVYGATPGGLSSAIAAARQGAKVILLEQTGHVGGLSTSGLDHNEGHHMYCAETFGGILNDFQVRVLKHYKKKDLNVNGRVGWESHVAEKIFNEMLAEAKVDVQFNKLIKDLKKDGDRIVSITMEDGTTYNGDVFIDGTYEGDLLGKSGASYIVGREPRDQYGESLAGVQLIDKPFPASPYSTDGSLLPGVSEGSPAAPGTGDKKFDCYNFRQNVTKDPANRVEITKPENYNPQDYELLARVLATGKIKKLNQLIGLYGTVDKNKFELNNTQYSTVSLGLLGEQFAWPEASYAEREKMTKAYKDYTQGFMWFLQNDPRVPKDLQQYAKKFGWCKDEWADNDHWPYYVYVREGRRMIGEYVVSQKDIRSERSKDDAICMGSHFIDDHHIERFAVGKDKFINEGRIWVPGKIFQIPYRSLIPKKGECANLLVPVACSSSHVAFCAIRLEPTWIQMGEAAGVAAAMAAEGKTSVQDVPVAKLQDKLRAGGEKIDMPNPDPSADSTDKLADGM